jgi:hypothetical protein
VSGKDALWVAAIGEKEGSGSTAKDSIDPRAFFVGPVRQSFGTRKSSVQTVRLSRYIDDDAKTITSLTGELRWHYAKGLHTIDTARAKGATGFLAAASPIELGDVTIESSNEYGSILIVSLDGKPLRTSKRILIQAATEDRPYGFATETVGKPGKSSQPSQPSEYHRITQLGGYPLNVRKIAATVRLKTSTQSAQILDGNGNPSDRRAQNQPPRRPTPNHPPQQRDLHPAPLSPPLRDLGSDPISRNRSPQSPCSPQSFVAATPPLRDLGSDPNSRSRSLMSLAKPSIGV